MELTALTELDAVNDIISVIGESPVNTLENITNVDAMTALQILRQVSRSEQSRGWSFNTIKNYTLNPDMESGRILWHDNYLYLKGEGMKLVRNGDYIMDIASGTRDFENPVQCEVILLIPFEDLPEAMRTYIIALATFKFQSRFFGDAQLNEIMAQTIQDAWSKLQEYELDNNDYNILNMTGVRKLRER